MEKYYTLIDSELGKLRLEATKDAIIGIYFDYENSAQRNDAIAEETALLARASHELSQYFSGKLTTFTVPIKFIAGTPFQQSVWEALRTIPYGETKSYKDIAKVIGNPKAIRAVGGANNKNPISIIVPCHRVIGVNGKMVGYGGGIERKVSLLKIEQGEEI